MSDQQGENWDGQDRRKPERWHVGKEVPLALLLTLALQTAGGVWWAASMSAKMDYAIQRMDEFARERYTREDARRDRELLQQRDIEHDRRLTEIEAAVRAKR